MEATLAWALLIIVGSTLFYLIIAKIIMPVIKMVKQNARLK